MAVADQTAMRAELNKEARTWLVSTTLTAIVASLCARLLAALRPSVARRFGFWYRTQTVLHPSWIGPINWRHVVELPHGFKLRVPFREVHGMEFILAGKYEPEVTERLETSLSAGDIFVDVGANIGYFSILASRLVGASGLVAAFEPSPLNLQALLEHLAHNRCENVVVFSSALSDTERLAALSVPPYYNCGVCSLRHNSMEANGSTTVLTQRFDSLPPSVLAPDRIRLIKIDTEGHEIQVLRGMRQFFARRTPLQVVLEWSPRWYSGAELLEFMTEAGFTGEVFLDNRWQPLRADSLPTCQCNAWFTRS